MDFLNTRNVLPALPLLTVGAAVGFGASRRLGIICAGLLALTSVVVLILVDTNPRYQRADWREAVEPGSRPTTQGHRCRPRVRADPAAELPASVAAADRTRTGE